MAWTLILARSASRWCLMSIYREDRYDTMYSAHPVLDRIPGRGITKKEHDAVVRGTGRNYTDPLVDHHAGSAGTQAQQIVTAPRPTTRIPGGPAKTTRTMNRG